MCKDCKLNCLDGLRYRLYGYKDEVDVSWEGPCECSCHVEEEI